MGSTIPSGLGPDASALVGWLGMVALDHGRTGAGTWLVAATRGTPPQKRRRRRSRQPDVAAELSPVSEGAVVAAEETGAQTLTAGEAAPERLVTEAEPVGSPAVPKLPKLSALEWREGAASEELLPLTQRLALLAARFPPPALPAAAALLLLLLAARRRGAKPGRPALAPADDASAASSEREGSLAAGMQAPVLKGSALAVRENGQWQERVLLLRVDNSLHIRGLSGGVADAVPLRGAAAAAASGEPLCFTLNTCTGSTLLLRCRSKAEAQSWVTVLNAAALAIGSPAPPSGRASAARMLPTPRHYSSDESEEGRDPEDDPLSPFPSGRPSRATLLNEHAWARMHTPRRPPPAVVRGGVIVGRPLLDVSMVPVRVTAALLILPFALVVHGLASATQALRSEVTGRRGLPAGLGEEREREQCSGDESNPEKRNLLDRFLCDAQEPREPPAALTCAETE